jgi:hypothetical protein
MVVRATAEIYKAKKWRIYEGGSYHSTPIRKRRALSG